MSIEDKAKGMKDQTTGKVKEVTGELTGDKELEAKGKAEGLLGKAKEAFGEAKDAVAEKFNDVVDDLHEDKKDK